MHERYELQILSGLKTAKLTGLHRHNESYESLIPNVQDIINNDNNIEEIKVFKRGIEREDFNPILIFPSEKYKTAIEAITDERIRDLEETKKEFESRYKVLIKQMNDRNAPKEQYEQLEKIKSNITI